MSLLKSRDAQAGSAVEQFKSFLENREPIELTFKRTVNPELYPAKEKPKAQFYHARWKTNTLYSIQLLTSRANDEVSPAAYYTGRSNAVLWSISGGHVFQYLVDPPEREAFEFRETQIPNDKEFLDEALDLLVFRLKRGTLRWSGLDFAAVTDEREPGQIKGRLLQTNGFVEGIEYSWRHHRFEVECFYPARSTSSFPDKVKQFRYVDGKRTLIEEIEFRDVRLLTDIDNAWFDPKRYANARGDTVFYSSNGSFYGSPESDLPGNGNAARRSAGQGVPPAPTMIGTTAPNFYRAWFVVLTVLVASFSAFWTGNSGRRK